MNARFVPTLSVRRQDNHAAVAMIDLAADKSIDDDDDDHRIMRTTLAQQRCADEEINLIDKFSGLRRAMAESESLVLRLSHPMFARSELIKKPSRRANRCLLRQSGKDPNRMVDVRSPGASLELVGECGIAFQLKKFHLGYEKTGLSRQRRS
jgi:hypothetical protein